MYLASFCAALTANYILHVAHLPPPSSSAISYSSRQVISMLQSSRSGRSLRVFGDLGLPNGEGIIRKLQPKPELFPLIASVYALPQQTKDSLPHFLTFSLSQSHPMTLTSLSISTHQPFLASFLPLSLLRGDDDRLAFTLLPRFCFLSDVIAFYTSFIKIHRQSFVNPCVCMGFMTPV